MIASPPSSSETPQQTSYDFDKLHEFLPPYRSLLSPNTRYDYQTHQLLHDDSDFRLNIWPGPKGGKKNKIKMKYKSLLAPINDTRKKILSAATDSLSIRSFKSVITLRDPAQTGADTEPITFSSLPLEVGDVIFGFLQNDTKTLINCLYVNKRFNELAKTFLYRSPVLTSTYRVGQFVNVIMNDPYLATLVETLDLSQLAPGLSSEGEAENYNILVDLLNNRDEDDPASPLSDADRLAGDQDSLAGWRDWKFRDHPLYGRRSQWEAPKQDQSSQPTPTPSARSRSRSRRHSSIISSGNSIFSTGNYSSDSTDLLRSMSNTSTTKSEKKSGATAKSLKRSLKKALNIDHKQVNLIHSYAALYDQPIPSSHHRRSSGGIVGPSTSPRQVGETIRKGGSRPSSASFNPVRESRYRPSSLHQPFSSRHPLANKFLMNYCFSKDLPVGYVIHLIQECEHLKVLNLSNLSLSPDFEMRDYEFFDWCTGRGKIKTPLRTGIGLNYGSMLLEADKKVEEPKLPPVSKPVFLSDTVMREAKQGRPEHKKLMHSEILEAASKLEGLEEIHLCSLIWTSKKDIFRFINDSRSIQNGHLRVLDATDSGMARGLPWARRRSVKEWRRYIDDDESYHNQMSNFVNVLLETMGEDY
ncbi:unnamed protein product [Kuraishia capsulata CBS 1993]|uniref:F-box domain-containing protein n=1 Tax=Kuraishia capsulata CBS 1993 TaxID=1382522 RepID=W6MNL8_9ASCO|nr:uncharacterized protein KUCA_T00003852001 [Kuraishia capsulata CBS 1993]CDK27873.1 unnamed protein product [Kuraishia capsulata CBS 1993]